MTLPRPVTLSWRHRSHRRGGGEGHRRGTKGLSFKRLLKVALKIKCICFSAFQALNEIFGFKSTFKPNKTSKGTLFMPPCTHSSRDTVPLLSASIAVIMSFRTCEEMTNCCPITTFSVFQKQVMSENLQI